MKTTPFTIRLPYFESIPVGSGATPALLAGYQYFVYSSPIEDPIEVFGFNANFADNSVRVQLADVGEREVWTPFFATPMTAVFGSLTQVNPVLYLSAPYRLEPGHKVQFLVQNGSVSPIDSTVITMVGIRLKTVEVAECFS